MALSWLRSEMSRLVSDRRGGALIMIGFAIIPLVAFVGLGVDSARAYLVRSRLATALDSAALAAGASVNATVSEMQQDVLMYMNANFPDELYGAELSTPQVSFSGDGDVITVSANATVGASFMRVMGFEDITIAASTEVTRRMRGLELALVMDNTGSMRWSGKMDAMRDAAHLLMDIMYGERETVDDFWVALVPYASVVNVGDDYQDWLSDYDDYTWEQEGSYSTSQVSWKGCVKARAVGMDQDDTVPSGAGLFETYHWASGGDNWWAPGSYNETDSYQTSSSYANGPNLACPTPILPLTAEKSTVTDAIDAMGAYRRFGTMSNVGMSWGWRTVSPDWQGLWGGDTPADLPLPYDEPLMDKAVILLTDGWNQWSGYSNDYYTAYGYPDDGELVDPVTTSSSRAELNSRLTDTCMAMKEAGVVIYAITFQVGDEQDLKDLYETCASGSDRYFDSPSNSELQNVFEAIGQDLSNLRVSK